MSKLSKLYAMITNAKELGINLGEDVYKQTDQLEEEIIKKEILPVVTQNIAPALKQVQRELVLVVDYIPERPISVHLSRKTNITELLDAKIMEMDQQAEHKTRKKLTKSFFHKNDKAILRVTFPDGTVISDNKAKVTFVETIRRIGFMRVRSLGMKYCHVPIVSNVLDKKYYRAQVPVENGLYIMTHSSTRDKKNQLDRISKEFKLGLIVEEI